MTQVLIDRATLEQLVSALDISQALLEFNKSFHYEKVLSAYKAGRAAIAKAEPTGFSLTNTSISDTSRTIESFFEAMDKEVAAGRLVRTGPMEWTKL